MGKKAPKAPDPYQTADAQAGMNRDAAVSQQLINMVNQNNPWGSVNYMQNGTTSYRDASGKMVTIPQFTQNTSFSPEQQAIFDKSQAAQGNLAGIAEDQSKWLADYLKGGVDTSGVPGLQSSYAGADDFSADRSRVEDAIMQRMAPYQQQDQEKLRSQLINQGLRPGTAAWDSEMDRLSRTETDARLGAILAGGSEQSRLVGLAQNAAAFNNQARGQGLQEAYTARNQPINEMMALLSGSQVSNPGQMSSATPQAGVAGVDYAGMVNNQYQQQMQNYQSGMGGLFGLAGSLGGAAITGGLF